MQKTNEVEDRMFRLVEVDPAETVQALSEVPERAPYVMFAEYPDIMTRAQGAKALGMNEKDFAEYLMTGRIKAYRDGRRWRVPKLALIEYVEERMRRGWWDAS